MGEIVPESSATSQRAAAQHTLLAMLLPTFSVMQFVEQLKPMWTHPFHDQEAGSIKGSGHELYAAA